MVAALRAVPGVADARIEPSTDGSVGMLHLALDEDTDDAAVASRVAELLRSGFGIGVDTDRVQLIEDPPARDEPIAEEWTAEEPAPAAAPVPALRGIPRLVFERLQLRVSGLEVRCAVTLSGSGREVTGEAVGAANSSGTLRAACGATLRAVERLATIPMRLEIENLELVTTGSDGTVLVSLTMLTPAGGSRLTGAAAVRQDVRQATVRATLDAVNRRVGPLLRAAGGSAG